MSRVRGRSAIPERVIFLCLFLATGVGLYKGWQVFWFLTDDAYIAFRYVSNSVLGLGYVWNAAPFQPVEGYTSFLWVVILDLTWKVTGVEPPKSANTIAFFFSYLTLLVSGLLLFRMKWSCRLQSNRLLFVALLMIFLLLNRSYLAGSSSGLETAMFCFLVTVWVFVFTSIVCPTRQALWGSGTAACIALTRPDGLLFCLATMVIVARLAFCAGERKRAWHLVFCASPLLVVPAHMGWRLWFYRSWLPNTYYAKVVEAWPQSGMRYALSFVLEYALWLVLAVLVAVGIVWLRSMKRICDAQPETTWKTRWGEFLSTGPVVTVVVTLSLLAHVAYYTLIVGGDHFEYRVYNHILPFCFISFVWSINRLQAGRWQAIGWSSALVILSLPVPWTHWALTHHLDTRQETHVMRVPIAPAWPQPLQWYARLFDEVQSWLIVHHVGMRHQEHKAFWKHQLNLYPSRQEGLRMSREGFPVFVEGTVGVPAWVMPHVNIMDVHGLNDFVIARTPVPEDQVRVMAHTRRPPPGYIQSFRPNVIRAESGITTRVRKKPLTADEIHALERSWWKKYGKMDPPRRTGASAPSRGVRVDSPISCPDK
jgi:arabinofuranosyltransferase